MLFIDVQNLIINARNIMMKIKNRHVKYGDVNNLYKWAVSQKLPVNGFKWDDDVS